MTMGFLSTDPGQEWTDALTASDLEPSAKAVAVAHAAYADEGGALVMDEATEGRVHTLASAILAAWGLTPDES